MLPTIPNLSVWGFTMPKGFQIIQHLRELPCTSKSARTFGHTVVYFLPVCCASRTLVNGSRLTSVCLSGSFRIQRHLEASKAFITWVIRFTEFNSEAKFDLGGCLEAVAASMAPTTAYIYLLQVTCS